MHRITLMLGKPHEEHWWCSFLGWNKTFTIRKNNLMPTIIMTIESSRPSAPVSVMSPKGSDTSDEPIFQLLP